jgi:hypothetical protein
MPPPALAGAGKVCLPELTLRDRDDIPRPAGRRDARPASDGPRLKPVMPKTPGYVASANVRRSAPAPMAGQQPGPGDNGRRDEM